jgi:integrase
VAAIHSTLSALLSAAVEDDRLARNPASGARLPKVEKSPLVPMTGDEVRLLAQQVPDHVRAAVLLSAGTGLRQGEAFGLTSDRVDFMRRELRVDRQLWTPATGPPVLAPPKSKNSYRTVALSQLVLDGLAAHLATFSTGVDGLMFHVAGRPVVRAMVGKYVRDAVSDVRPVLDGRTWHHLRHYHASSLLSAGVSPALVAERLGHDVATLLKTYAHVIRKDEDRVRTIVDHSLGGSAEDFLRTEAK